MFYLKQVKKSEAVGLMCLASLLVAIYIVWFLLTIRYHFQVWFKWRINNQDIRLLDTSNVMPVMSQDQDLDYSSQTVSTPQNQSVASEPETPDKDDVDCDSSVLEDAERYE